MKKRTCFLFFFWIFHCSFEPCAAAGVKEFAAHLDRLIGPRDAVMLTNPLGKVLYNNNENQQLIPASIIKILTSLVALHTLGPTFRFKTAFYIDSHKNLIIKGFGDPLLISEVLPLAVSNLYEGLTSHAFNDLILDTTYFDEPIRIPGLAPISTQPYDAPIGALGVNFNTIHFERNKAGKIISAEPQTPLVEFAKKRIMASKLQRGRIIFSARQDEMTLYAGHLWHYFLSQKGISITGTIKRGQLDTATSRHLYTFRSPYLLTEVIAKLHHYSNNFIANQLFITSGAEALGPPGTLAKGCQTATLYLSRYFKNQKPVITEGSGLSRHNRIAAAQMIRLLELFQPYHQLLRQDEDSFYKTGTLTGIHTRAGYLFGSKKDELYPFIIMVNTKGKSITPILRTLIKVKNGFRSTKK